MKKAIYAGSFDPFHEGHRHIVERALAVFDQVHVVVANNPGKSYALYSPELRASTVQAYFPNLDSNSLVISCLPTNEMVSDYAVKHGIKTLIKGVRTLQDVEYERMLHEITVANESGLDTFFLLSQPGDYKISSTAVKELMKFNADVRQYIPLYTKHLLEYRQNHQFIIGVTGELGSGKSTLCAQARSNLSNQSQFPLCHNISVDVLMRKTMYTGAQDNELTDFGYEVYRIAGIPPMVNEVPNKLGLRDVFVNDKDIRDELNALSKKAVPREVSKALRGLNGIILIEHATLIDWDLTYICNNNVILVDAPPACKESVWVNRYGNQALGRKIAKQQLTFEEKEAKMLTILKQSQYGNLCNVRVSNWLRNPISPSNDSGFCAAVKSLSTGSRICTR